jgi:hypothetical protein
VKGITPRLNPRVRILGKNSAEKKNETRIRKPFMIEFSDFTVIDRIIMKIQSFKNLTGKDCTSLYLGFDSCKALAKELSCNYYDIFYNQGKGNICGMKVYGVVVPDHLEVS